MKNPNVSIFFSEHSFFALMAIKTKRPLKGGRGHAEKQDRR